MRHGLFISAAFFAIATVNLTKVPSAEWFTPIPIGTLNSAGNPFFFKPTLVHSTVVSHA